MDIGFVSLHPNKTIYFIKTNAKPLKKAQLYVICGIKKKLHKILKRF